MSQGNYFAQDFNPWVDNIRRIGTMLAQMPERRAQIQAMQAEAADRQERIKLMRAQEEEAGAHTGEYDASSRKLNAEAADQEGRTAASGRLSDAIKIFSQNPNDHDAQIGMTSELGHFLEKNPQQGVEALGRMMALIQARTGDTNFAEQGSLQGNAASIANNQANNARIMATPMNVPDNNIAIDKRTGEAVAGGLQRLAAGQRLFAPEDFQLSYNTQPTVSGPPAPPKSSSATQERNRYIGRLMTAETNPARRQALLDEYDRQTGYTPDSGAAAPAAPQTINVGGFSVPISAAVASAAPTNAPASASAAPVISPSASFSSADAVKAAYRAGQLDRATAQQILQKQFGMQ